MKNYLYNVVIAVDQLGNSILGGWADETLSSRSYRWHMEGVSWPKNLIDLIFFWEDAHCAVAYRSERTGRHLPPELREVDLGA